MYRHLGHHYVKKYNHTLIINTVYQDPKPNRDSQAFTSASSRPARDISMNKNLEQNKKKQKNYLFSPQVSLERYRAKVKCSHSSKSRTKGESDIKLIISAINQNRPYVRRCETPNKQMTRQSTFCSHCLNREKHQNERRQKRGIEQQNTNKLEPLFKDTRIYVKMNEVLPTQHSDRLFSSLRGSNKKSIQQNKKQLLQLPVQVRPWQMSASDSSI